MVAILGTIIFASAFVAATGVITMSIAPQWERIARTLAGSPDMVLMPFYQPVAAERRIAITRRAVAQQPAMAMRAAA